MIVHIENIIKVSTNCDGTCWLVYTKKKEGVGYILQEFLDPIFTLVYEHTEPFAFAVDRHYQHLLVVVSCTVYLYESINCGWRLIQTFSRGDVSTLGTLGTLGTFGIAMSDGVMIERTLGGLVGFFPNGTVQHMSNHDVKIDFEIFADSILAEHNILVTSTPDFGQLDGVVDIYDLKQSLFEIDYRETISPPTRASHFGQCVVACTLNHQVMLFISAPFTRNGMGTLYIYRRLHDVFELYQSVENDNVTNHTEQFGHLFSVSADSKYLVVASLDYWYVFLYCDLKYELQRTQPYSSALTGLYITNNGNVLCATHNTIEIY
jgi:hypothetical protein